MHLTRSACVLVFVLVSFLPQPQAQKEAKPAQFKAAVNLVTVDVVITDRKGIYPVALQKSDFEVFEDGVQQVVRDFVAWQPSAPPAAPASPPIAAGPVGAAPNTAVVIPSGVSPARIAPSDRRLFILLFDNLTSQWGNLAQMSTSIEKFLTEKLETRDLVAVLAATDSVRIVQKFTNNRQALLDATRRILRRSVDGSVGKSTTDYMMNEANRLQDMADQTGDPADAQAAEVALGQAVTMLSLQNDFSARGTLATLRHVCDSLRPITGRKAVVLVSEGFATTRATQTAMSIAVDAANKSNISIYTINPRGLEPRDTAEPLTLRQNPRQRNFQTTGRVFGGNSDFDMIMLENRANTDDDGLTGLSASTGGLAFRNSNDYLKGLATVVDDSHSYYQLTYLPSNAVLDGKFRRIEVKVQPKGLSVRARRGYFAGAQSTAFIGTVEDQLHQALNSPQRVEGLPFQLVPSVFLSPTGEPFTRVAVHLPAEGVHLMPDKGHLNSTFKLAGGVFDERGQMVRAFQRDFRVDIAESASAAFADQGASLSLEATLPPGKYQVKVVLREGGTGKMGSTLENLEVPTYTVGTPYLSSIVLATAMAVAPVPVPTGKAGPPAEPYNPLRYGENLVFPSNLLEFQREGMLTLFFHAYNVASVEDPAQSPYVYQIRLFRDKDLFNRSVSYPIANPLVHPVRGYLTATQLPLQPLPAGDYIMEVVVAMPDGANMVRRSVRFKLL